MLENVSTDDVLVQVIDGNAQGNPTVYDDRLNEGEIAPCDCQEDDQGYANLTTHTKRASSFGSPTVREAAPGPGDTVEISP